ncbi:MAG: AAA family ATPase [Planctomycetes bacterium]|nr:AAA family ATPase [Planctomycetota bacterium]
MKNTIEQYNKAGYPIIWILANEPSRVVTETNSQNKVRWDSVRGLSLDLIHYEEVDPIAVIETTAKLQETVIFLENYHHYLENPAVIQSIVNAVPLLKSNGSTLVILSPVLAVPPELSTIVRVLDQELPSREEYSRCLDEVLPEGMAPMGKGDEERIVQAGSGMTLASFEDAVALSLVTNGRASPELIWNEKADMIRKSGAEIYRGTERFMDIGGLDGLKQFCLRSLTSGRKGARGALLLGVPGTGKSLFAKALGNEVGRCTVGLDLGRMFSSLVGETERNIRETLKIVDKLEPSILFIDEIEKGLSGIQSSGKTDGGTGSRMFGTLLTWLNDHQSDTYVIATCNSVEDLPPEFLRQERWDGIFFVDIPGFEERERIWSLYKTKYGISEEHPESCTGFTGAEIKSACRLAHIQNISLGESVKMTIPLTVSAGERVEEIRKKASGKCLSASDGQIYRLDQKAVANNRRITPLLN